MLKRTLFLLTMIPVLSFSVVYGEDIAAAAAAPTEELNIEEVAEAIGHFLARNLKTPGMDLDLNKVIQGMRDEEAGKPSPLTQEEYEKRLAKLQERIFLQQAEKNLSEATAFLDKNATAEGIVALDPKIQYKIEQCGEGEEITSDSTPLVHYRGKLMDGSTFASSYEMGEPVSLPLQQTIPGFGKGMAGMKEGEKRTLYIHPDLAYGVAGHLPPNSLLIFEVEVVKAEGDEAIAQADDESSDAIALVE